MRPTPIALSLLAVGFLLAPGAACAQSRRAQLQAGFDMLQKGKEADALAAFRKLTEQDPACLEAWNNRAALEAARGDLTAANASLERALEANPDLSTIHQNLGKVRSRLARLAYDSAFGTPSTLSPLKLEMQREITNRSGDPTTENSRDSLLRELDALRESTRRELAKRDSLLDAESAAVRRLQVALDKALAAKAQEGIALAQTNSTARQEVAPTSPSTKSRAPAAYRGAESTEGVLAALRAWAQAWSDQDVDGYLAFYSSRFVPLGGADRNTWENYRRERLTSPKSIQVGISATRVRMLKNHRAEVSFRQTYQTEATRLTSRKRLEFTWELGGWKILAEREAR